MRNLFFSWPSASCCNVATAMGTLQLRHRTLFGMVQRCISTSTTVDIQMASFSSSSSSSSQGITLNDAFWRSQGARTHGQLREIARREGKGRTVFARHDLMLRRMEGLRGLGFDPAIFMASRSRAGWKEEEAAAAADGGRAGWNADGGREKRELR